MTATAERLNGLDDDKLDLADKFAKKEYFNRHWHTYTLDDLVSIATTGLLVAIREYTASKGISFSTYAYGCMRNELTRALPQDTTIQVPAEKRRQGDDAWLEVIMPGLGVGSTDQTVPDGDEFCSVIDTVATLDMNEETDLHLAMQEVLDDRERTALKLFYTYGFGGREVGDALGTYATAAYRIRDQALVKLRKWFGVESVEN